MSLGRLVVDLVANTGQFIQGINGATRNARTGAASIVSSFGTLVKAQLTAELGMQALSGAVSLFTSSIERAGAAIDSTGSFGTLPSKFYEMQYAIESAGDSFEPVTKVMAVLSNELGGMKSALDGNGPLIQALGLNFKDLKDADPTDAIRQVAIALEQVEDPTMRARLGTALLGKAWKEAAPGLATLASNMAQNSGVTQQMLESADELGDAFGRMQLQTANLALIVSGSLSTQLVALGSIFSRTEDDSVGLGKAMSTGLAPIITGISYVVLAATTNFKKWALTLAGVGAAIKAVTNKDWEGLKAIPEQWSAGLTTIANDASLASNTIRQAAAGIGKAEGVRADEHDKASVAAAAAAAQAKILADALAATGAKSAAVNPITQVFQQMRESILKAKLESRDFDIAKFASMKGATPALVKKYTLLVDTLAAETGLKSFRDEMKGMNRELALVGSGETETALANLRTKLEDAKVPADKINEAIEKMRGLLTAKTDIAFAKDLAAVNVEIAKIGKNSQQQAEIDIRTKYEGDPGKQGEMLAASTRKYAREAEEQVSDMMRKLETEAASLKATPLTQYVAELKETQRLNPLISNEIIASATAQKAANLDLAKSYEQNQQFGKDMTSTISSDLFDIARGTKTASEGFKSMTRAVADLIIKYTIMKPFEDMLSKGMSGGSGGGGWVGAVADGISTFFGGGKAMGGGVASNSMHEVVEQGPELLTSGGKTFLMTGSQGGNVTPFSKIGGSGDGGVTINQTFVINNSSDSQGLDQKLQGWGRRIKEETIAAVQIKTHRGEMRR